MPHNKLLTENLHRAMKKYLEVSEFIDWNNSDVIACAKYLRGSLESDIDIARVCFEFVRDEIKHSWDYKINEITCSASEVLRHKSGYCYSQSHLLAALLRANSIPAGLCYQRLSLEDEGEPYCLHGLNAIYLKEFGWYRVDPRGNKEGVDARFNPPSENLAFTTNGRLEADIQGIWPEPLPIVVRVLKDHNTYMGVYENLPDIEVFS